MKLLFCLLLAIAAVSAQSGVSDFYSSADADAAVSFITAAQKTDGSFGGIKETYEAVWILQTLNRPVPNSDKVCDFASSALSQGITAETFSYAIKTRALLQCKEADRVPSKVEAELVAAVDESADLIDIYHAVSALSALPSKNIVKSETLTKLISALSERADDNGQFYGSADSKKSPSGIFNSGIAFETLAAIVSNRNLGAEDSSALDELLEKVENLLLLGEDNDDLFFFGEEDSYSSLDVTSSVFSGLAALSKAKQSVDVEASQITGAAEFFIGFKHSSSISTLYSTLRGLTASNSFSKKPTVLSITNTAVSSSNKGSKDSFIKVLVTDVFGAPVKDAKVFLIKANEYGSPSSVVLENQELFHEEDYFGLNFLAVKPNPGYFELELRVDSVSKSHLSIDEVTKVIKVTATVGVTHLKVQIGDREESEDAREWTAEQPAKIAETLKAGVYQHIRVSFRLKNNVSNKPLLAHQAFVRLTNKATGVSNSYVAKRQGNLFKASLNLQAVAEDFNSRSGEYSVAVLIGDACLENPVDWEVAVINFSFGKESAAAASPWDPLPEIKHVFRTPPNRPPEIFSLGFAAAVLAPVGLLLITWLRVGVNGKNFPGGANSLAALGFVGGIGALMGWFLLYWLSLNMFQCLAGLVVIGAWTFVTGRQTLKSIADARVKSKKE